MQVGGRAARSQGVEFGDFAHIFPAFFVHDRVNVNTTDATTGATPTALLLPAQNTHTLHDPI